MRAENCGDRHVPVLREEGDRRSSFLTLLPNDARSPCPFCGGDPSPEDDARRGDRARAVEARNSGVKQCPETSKLKTGPAGGGATASCSPSRAVADSPARVRRGPRKLRALELDGLELELAALLGLGHLVVEVLGRQRLLGLALALAASSRAAGSRGRRRRPWTPRGGLRGGYVCAAAADRHVSRRAGDRRHDARVCCAAATAVARRHGAAQWSGSHPGAFEGRGSPEPLRGRVDGARACAGIVYAASCIFVVASVRPALRFALLSTGRPGSATSGRPRTEGFTWVAANRTAPAGPAGAGLFALVSFMAGAASCCGALVARSPACRIAIFAVFWLSLRRSRTSGRDSKRARLNQLPARKRCCHSSTRTPGTTAARAEQDTRWPSSSSFW